MPLRHDVSEPLLDANRLAAYFAVSDSTIRRWRRRGMPSIKYPGGARRYRISECERWLREMGG